jgi:hypothetical protein
MRQEYWTFKRVASNPCEWLLLVLAMRMRVALLTKTDGQVGDGKAFGLASKSIHNVIAWYYLTKIYLKILRASSCGCTGIVGVPPP